MPVHAHAQTLRDAGLQITDQRLAAYDEVVRRPHSDVDTIAAGVRAVIGSVSTQAVYDGLRALTAAGLLRRIEPAGSRARFETRVGDNHHHLVCRGCGALISVARRVGPCHASGYPTPR